MVTGGGVHLGIDVGTATVTAVTNDGRQARPVTDPVTGSGAIPAALYPDGAGGLLLGAAAAQQLRADVDGVDPNLKRRLTVDGDLALGRRRYTRVELLSHLLRWLTAGATVARTVLTVPPAYD